MANLTQLIGLLMPLVSALMYMISIIKWDSPLLSFSVLVTWIVVCQYLGYFPAFVVTALLMYTLWGSVKERARKAAFQSMHEVNNAMLTEYQKEGSDVAWEQQEYHRQGETTTDDDTEDNSDVGLLTKLVRTVLPSSLNSTLRTVCNLCQSTHAYCSITLCSLLS